MTIKQIANHLGRTPKFVNSKVHCEGVTVLRECNTGEKNKKLTKSQVRFVKDNIGTMCLGDIVRKLHTSTFNIEDIMKQHGIVKIKKKKYIDKKMQDYIDLMKRVEMVKKKLTRDPEVKYGQSANPVAVARYGIAVRRQVTMAGELEVDFFNVVAFGKAAEFVQKWFKKGNMIAIIGRLQVSTW